MGKKKRLNEKLEVLRAIGKDQKWLPEFETDLQTLTDETQQAALLLASIDKRWEGAFMYASQSIAKSVLRQSGLDVLTTPSEVEAHAAGCQDENCPCKAYLADMAKRMEKAN